MGLESRVNVCWGVCRACRLKKKAQYEANKVKLWGLSTEYGESASRPFWSFMHMHQHSIKIQLISLPSFFPPSDRLLFVINTIKEEIVTRVEDSSPRPTNMSDTLEHLIQQTLGEDPVSLDGRQNQTVS